MLISPRKNSYNFPFFSGCCFFFSPITIICWIYNFIQGTGLKNKEAFGLSLSQSHLWRSGIAHVWGQNLVFILNFLTRLGSEFDLHSKFSYVTSWIHRAKKKKKRERERREQIDFSQWQKSDGKDSGLIIERSHLCQSNCLWQRGKNKSFSKTPLLQNLVQCHRAERQIFYLAEASRGKAQRQFTRLAWAEFILQLFFVSLLSSECGSDSCARGSVARQGSSRRKPSWGWVAV